MEHMWGISLGTLWEHTWKMMGTQNPKNIQKKFEENSILKFDFFFSIIYYNMVI